MGKPVNKYCFNQPFDVVERMADTCQARNSKTKAFKNAKKTIVARQLEKTIMLAEILL